ncbi:neuropeptide Y receptor type 2 [Diprion similis]|uniref:neuropeptide Y receptor type 2 n=1 Tax=Diprion similis TaxID=362088 RepID=UPI001EF9B49F|nr:neuropeptide Y receptor type 2 [Diprion similis]
MLNNTGSFSLGQSIFKSQGTNYTDGILNDYFDTTQHYFPNDIWKVRPAWEVTLKVATMIPVVVVGLVGNISLMYVIIRTPTLHTTTNILIANMALADFGTTLFCPWMFLCFDLFQNYIFGSIGCHLDGLLSHALTLVAVFSLSAVSYDRVSLIVLSTSRKLSKRTTYVLLCTTWVAGLVVAAPLAFFRQYRTRQWIDYLETYCTENSLYLAFYWSIFVCISVWAPLTIMAVCHTAILIKLDRYERVVRKSKHPIQVKYKRKVARILALLVLVFIICRVPFTMLILQRNQLLQHPAQQQQADSIYILWYTSRYLVLLNAAVNPILYGCSNRSLRQALASCAGISWILRNGKVNFTRRSNIVRNTPDQRDIPKPHSPSFHPDNQHGPLPNVSSIISPIAYTPVF